MTKLKDRCAIVGVGESDAIGKVPDVSSISMQMQALRAAVADAGLTKNDVDGLFSFLPSRDPTFLHSVWLAESLGINPRFTSNINMGGATPATMVMQAIGAISVGLCEVAVCVFGEKGRTAGNFPKHGKMNQGYENWERPYGRVGAPVGYALAAQRHMHEYGTTSDQLGAIAVAIRSHGAMNPRAQLQQALTLEDYRKARSIVDPLKLPDCCLVSDGAAAVVVVSAERALDLRHRPAYIMGAAQSNPQRRMSKADNLTICGARESGAAAFAVAGITPQDIDVAQIYDCFTNTVLVQLEDLGFCPKGEGGPWVEGGRITLGGELPINTDGGLLSYCYLEGMGQIVEAVRQLRGDCGPRQVPNAEIALVTGNAGELSSHCTLILRR